MIKIQEIQVKGALTKSKLPESDYCINPYIGCIHGCIYCYARFMKRFTGHTENWGEFVDVKLNAAEVLRRELSSNPKSGVALLGSVTDAYQSLEKKYRITRAILEVLLEYQFPISILTKSDLVLRDIDLLTQFKSCDVGVTITTLDDLAWKRFEPKAVSTIRRLRCLQQLHDHGIRTYVFIGPILPIFTDLREIYRKISKITDSVWGESLSTRCGNWNNIENMLNKFYPDLRQEFEDKSKNKDYWDSIGNQLHDLSVEYGIPLVGYYRH